MSVAITSANVTPNFLIVLTDTSFVLAVVFFKAIICTTSVQVTRFRNIFRCACVL